VAVFSTLSAFAAAAAAAFASFSAFFAAAFSAFASFSAFTVAAFSAFAVFAAAFSDALAFLFARLSSVLAARFSLARLLCFVFLSP